MDSKDKILLRAMAILIVLATIVTATAADARLFDWLGWQYGWDMCWWH